MNCDDFIKILENKFPLALSEAWDNSGWQLGTPKQEINGILVCLDPRMQVIDEAVKNRCNLVISHHPLFFRNIKRVIDSEAAGKLAMEFIQAGLNLYSAHTNLDIAEDGINDYLATLIGLQKIKLLSKTMERNFYKLSVFVPSDYSLTIRRAIGEAGAGTFRNYTDCTFTSSGTGTFKPLNNSKPFIGNINQINEIKEDKIEAIVCEELLNTVISAMRSAHPYEEVAYDVVLLENLKNHVGIGRIGEYDQSMHFKDFMKLLNQALNSESFIVYGKQNIDVKKVAICGGSGGDFISEAISAGVDVYISGDIKYHQAMDAQNDGITVIDVGHYESEAIFIAKFAEIIRHLISKNGQGLKDAFPVISFTTPLLQKEIIKF